MGCGLRSFVRDTIRAEYTKYGKKMFRGGGPRTRSGLTSWKYSKVGSLRALVVLSKERNPGCDPVHAMGLTPSQELRGDMH